MVCLLVYFDAIIFLMLNLFIDESFEPATQDATFLCCCEWYLPMCFFDLETHIDGGDWNNTKYKNTLCDCDTF